MPPAQLDTNAPAPLLAVKAPLVDVCARSDRAHDGLTSGCVPLGRADSGRTASHHA